MTNSRLIGHIYSSKFQFYNIKTHQVEFKNRPVLIIGIEKDTGPCDLTVLPLSSVSKKENLLPKYDVEIIYNSYRRHNSDIRGGIETVLREVKNYTHTGKSKPVNQYDLNGKFINSYSSTGEAARSIGAKASSHIGECCRGKIKSYKGFVWRYAEDIISPSSES